MYKKLNILFLTLVLAACSNSKVETFSVDVNLANADGQTVYLQKYAGEQLITLDSAVIQNWDASFKTPVCSDNEMYYLMTDGWRRPVAFFTDNHDVRLEGDKENPNAIVVTGSESQNQLVAFTEGFNAIDARVDSLGLLLRQAKETGDAGLVEQLTMQHDDAQVAEKMYCFDYIWENPYESTAHYVLYRYKWAFSPCEIRSLIDNIAQTDSTITSSNLELAKTYLEKQERVQVGQPILDFTQNDPDGNPVTLSLLAFDKLLLVDFWAAWCPDCRRANPDVVKAYQMYHDQGFDVLGVSLDSNREAWLAAIEKDGLTWTQVSDLQGWNNAAALLYSVSFIPQNALIKDGVIVARNLEGDALLDEIQYRIMND